MGADSRHPGRYKGIAAQAGGLILRGGSGRLNDTPPTLVRIAGPCETAGLRVSTRPHSSGVSEQPMRQDA